MTRMVQTFTAALTGTAVALCSVACGPVCATREANLASSSEVFDAAQLDISMGEALAQARVFPGDVCVRDALNLALRLLVTSDEDSESPRALLGDHGRHMFAHPDSRLTLLARGSMTPRAEQPAHAWIFVLRMPALSDHIFYAVIGRQRDYRGRIHGYTYGFN